MKYKFNPTPHFEPSPILELYRGKLYCSLLKMFISNCVKEFGIKCFNTKKPYPRTLKNILSSWFFSLYAKTDEIKDPFFGTLKDGDMKILKEILLDMVKFDPSIKNINFKIEKILNLVKSNYQNIFNIIYKYRNSKYYDNNKDSYQITKDIFIIDRDNKEYFFYKFNIDVNFKIYNKRLKNILNNILIPKQIYENLKNRYTGKYKLDNIIWIILFRYQLLGSNNHQLGVLPEILNEMKQDIGLNFECFASAINSTNNYFCSIYYDVEKYFGSKGSFFKLEPIEGTFGFNPPYQKEIIEDGIEKLFTFLDKENKLTFVITIPIWDKKGKEKMNEKSIIDYGDFKIIEKMENSKFFKGKLMIDKENFTYLDHNYQLLKNKTIQHTYIFILSNDEKDYNKFLDKYKNKYFNQ